MERVLYLIPLLIENIFKKNIIFFFFKSTQFIRKALKCYGHSPIHELVNNCYLQNFLLEYT